MVFGTSEELSGEKNTVVQDEVSGYIQHAWAVFAKEGVEGLKGELGWPVYDPQWKTTVRLGYGEEVSANFVGNGGEEGICEKF